MNKLLSFNPEPFEDPTEPQGEPDREVEFAEDEMEEERGRRGSRGRAFPSRQGGRPRRGGRRPIIRLPWSPFIPSAWPVYPIYEPLQDAPPGRDAYRIEPPGGEPTEPTAEPADPEPAAEWESSTVSRRRRRTPSRPALSSATSPGAPQPLIARPSGSRSCALPIRSSRVGATAQSKRQIPGCAGCCRTIGKQAQAIITVKPKWAIRPFRMLIHGAQRLSPGS